MPLFKEKEGVGSRKKQERVRRLEAGRNKKTQNESYDNQTISAEAASQLRREQ